MKLNRKLALVLALLVSLVAVTTGTLAYLTDQDTKVNTFTVGNVDIEVEEEFEPNSPLNPGIEVEKQAGIENIHATSPAWVWMTVSVPENLVDHLELGWLEGTEYTQLPESAHEGYVSFLVLHEDELQPGETTPMYLQSVTLGANVDFQDGQYVAVVDGVATPIGNFSSVDVIVDGFAMQVDGFTTVEDAYDAYTAQWNGLNGGESGAAGATVDTVDELKDALANGETNIIYTGNDPLVISEALTVSESVTLNLDSVEVDMTEGSITLANGADMTITNGTIVTDGNEPVFRVNHADSQLTLGSGLVIKDATQLPAAGLVSVYKGTLELDGATLTNNVGDNTGHLVDVGNGCELIINDGTVFSGNAITGKVGGRPASLIRVGDATVTMNGGEIIGNTFGDNCLIYVDMNGEFIMENGEISGNTGSGPLVNAQMMAAFTMNDGLISGNTASQGFGAGMRSSVTINGGEISGNNWDKLISNDTYLTVGPGANVQ